MEEKIKEKISKTQKELHRKRYEIYIQDWKEGKRTGAKATQFAISGYVRRYLFEINKNKCSKCGWSEINIFSKTIPLEINHIDGNCINNRPENLELLCPNCHSLTSTHGFLNKGNGNKQRLRYYKV